MAGSHNKYWWKCRNCGYEWQTRILYRIIGHNCPQCAVIENRQRVLKGPLGEDRSLQYWCENNNPHLLEEWHSLKNGNLTPNDVTYASSNKFWWNCSLGHEWQAEIEHRTLLNQNCPYCYRIRLSKRVQNIETGEIFDSLELAAKSCGLKRGYHISNCCKGKENRAGGYHWKYVD